MLAVAQGTNEFRALFTELTPVTHNDDRLEVMYLYTKYSGHFAIVFLKDEDRDQNGLPKRFAAIYRQWGFLDDDLCSIVLHRMVSENLTREFDYVRFLKLDERIKQIFDTWQEILKVVNSEPVEIKLKKKDFFFW